MTLTYLDECRLAGLRWVRPMHNQDVDVPHEVDLLIAGFSCKELSSLNNDKKNLTRGGSSGDTLRAIVAYAKAHNPRMIMLENVFNLKSKMEIVDKMFRRVGYHGGFAECNSNEYLLPQCRGRLYLFYGRMNGDDPENQLKAPNFVKSFRCKERFKMMDLITNHTKDRGQKDKQQKEGDKFKV